MKFAFISEEKVAFPVATLSAVARPGWGERRRAYGPWGRDGYRWAGRHEHHGPLDARLELPMRLSVAQCAHRVHPTGPAGG
jgi:hypothetical protein